MELRDQLQASLGSGYVIERELGGGGMSRVFVADEMRLGRKIVVKVLAPELADGVNVGRFMREISLAATLQHPCIVPVLSAGETNELPYYTMPLVAGRSLRQRIADGPVPETEAVKTLRDIASALSAAHERGVVHRDVKPENVLLSGDYAVVTDFGIAKALADARTQPNGALTQLGAALGTPAYMAPEQIAGDPAIDHRADLYAWGVVAYEMLAGAPPFSGRSVQALLVAHLTEAPRPIGEVAAVTPGLGALVMRCLAKEPSVRPATAREVVGALDALRAWTPPGSLERAIPSVAVLPFANLSNDPDNEYFSDGITDEIISTLAASLACSRSIRVTSRGSSFALKGKAIDHRSIGQQLGVTTLVEGSVRKAGNRVRISAELVHAHDGFQLWSERFDRELVDVFQVQEEIARAIAGALAEHLGEPSPVEAPAAPMPHKVDPAAYEEYLKGLHLRNRMIDGGLREGIVCLERAVAIDPRFARAWSALGGAYYSTAIYGGQRARDVFPKALEALRTAIALDDMLGEPRALLGYMRFMYEWDWDSAHVHMERALTLAPDDSIVLGRAALLAVSLGRTSTAERLCERTIQVDPMSTYAHYLAGLALVTGRQVDRGREILEAGLRIHPQHSESWRFLGIGHLFARQFDDAAHALARSRELAPQHIWCVADQVILEAWRGNLAQARFHLGELQERMPAEHLQHFIIGWVHMALGELDIAFEEFHQAVDEREFWMSMWGVDPRWDPIRADPRYEEIRRRIGIPAEVPKFPAMPLRPDGVRA